MGSKINVNLFFSSTQTITNKKLYQVTSTCEIPLLCILYTVTIQHYPVMITYCLIHTHTHLLDLHLHIWQYVCIAYCVVLVNHVRGRNIPLNV